MVLPVVLLREAGGACVYSIAFKFRLISLTLGEEKQLQQHEVDDHDDSLRRTELVQLCQKVFVLPLFFGVGRHGIHVAHRHARPPLPEVHGIVVLQPLEQLVDAIFVADCLGLIAHRPLHGLGREVEVAHGLLEIGHICAHLLRRHFLEELVDTLRDGLGGGVDLGKGVLLVEPRDDRVELRRRLDVLDRFVLLPDGVRRIRPRYLVLPCVKSSLGFPLVGLLLLLTFFCIAVELAGLRGGWVGVRSVAVGGGRSAVGDRRSVGGGRRGSISGVPVCR